MTETKQYKQLKLSYVDLLNDELRASSHYHPFLTTTRFKYIPLSSLSKSCKYRFFTDDTWSHYSKVYRFILSQLNKNYQKKRYIHPRTYDFLDVDGTRDNPCASFTETTIPHIHSIYLVHDQTLERFQSLIDSDFRSVVEHHSNHSFLSSIHAEPITEDLPKVVSYCSKFYDTYQARPIRDDYPFFNQFPVPEFEKEALKQYDRPSPFTCWLSPTGV